MSRGKIKRQYVELFLLLTLWIFYALIVTPWATNPGEHLKILLLSFLYTTFSIICAIIISGNYKRFIKSFELALIIWIIINLATLFLNFTGKISYGTRDFSGVYFNRNILAVTGLPFLVFIVFLRTELIFLNNNIRFSIVLLSLIIIILSTQSTKGLIGIILIAVLYVVSLKNLKRTLSVSIALLGLFLILFFALDLEVTSIARNKILGFIGIHEKNESESIYAGGETRNFLIREGLKVAMQNPITGIGVNNSKYHLFTESYYSRLARGQKPESGLVSHNNYVEMLLNGGVPAFILYYFPIVYIILLLFRNQRSESMEFYFRKFFLSTILLKLVLDIGMISYMNFTYIFMIACSYIFYYNNLKSVSIPGEMVSEHNNN